MAVTPPAIAAVPESAGVGAAAFFSYILSLSSSDESSEPLPIKDSFAVPPKDSAETNPLT